MRSVASHEDGVLQLAGSGAAGGQIVSDRHGVFAGHCEGTLRLATALDNARVD